MRPSHAIVTLADAIGHLGSPALPSMTQR